MIPIIFIPSNNTYGNQNIRPIVLFSNTFIAFGKSAIITATSKNGWVFDLNLTGNGECSQQVFEITGGTINYIEGFSGDEVCVVFEIIHDSISTAIQVIYNTRPD